MQIIRNYEQYFHKSNELCFSKFTSKGLKYCKNILEISTSLTAVEAPSWPFVWSRFYILLIQQFRKILVCIKCFQVSQNVPIFSHVSWTHHKFNTALTLNLFFDANYLLLQKGLKNTIKQFKIWERRSPKCCVKGGFTVCPLAETLHSALSSVWRLAHSCISKTLSEQMTCMHQNSSPRPAQSPTYTLILWALRSPYSSCLSLLVARPCLQRRVAAGCKVTCWPIVI